MKEKPTILMVHNHYQLGGGEDTVVSNEKRMLEEHGHKVVLYTGSNNEIKKMNLFQKLLLPFTTIYNPKTARDIKRIIQEEDIDIVHVHNTLSLISPAVYYASIKMHKPVVQTIHNFRLLCPGATFYRDNHICEDCVSKGLRCSLKHKCYRNSFVQTLVCVMSTKIHRATGIYSKINYICLTEFNKNKLLELKEIDSNQVFVKPNFVKQIASVTGTRKEQYVFVGRLDKLKGIDFLFNTWKKMGEDAPKLVVCGTGAMEDWCKTFIEENKVNIELKGFVPNGEVHKVIAESKALILPTEWYEGFPMTIVEAFSVGTPVIGSDIGNVGSIISNGETGYKFKVHNSDDLMSVICDFEKLDDKKMNELREHIIEVYLEKYSEESNYHQLVNIYHHL